METSEERKGPWQRSKEKHTHTFNGHFSRTTWVSRHQKGKLFWILLKQEMMGWQWVRSTSAKSKD